MDHTRCTIKAVITLAALPSAFRESSLYKPVEFYNLKLSAH